MADMNRRITLAQRPSGAVTAACFAIDEAEIPTPGPGEVLVKFAVDVVDGLDNAPVALDRLFSGANQGKVMVRL